MPDRKITVWGDIVGRYIVRDEGPDGRLVLEPDRSSVGDRSVSQIAVVEQAAAQGPAALDALVRSVTDPEGELWIAITMVAQRNEEVALSMYRVMNTKFSG